MVCSLAGVLLGYSYGIQIERVLITFRIPEYRFVATRESKATVKPMLKMPDDSIPKTDF